MLHIVLIAGGNGTRFWPVSRAVKPKQFLSIISDTPLIEETLHRIEDICPKSNRWIVGAEEHSRYLSALSKWVPETNILKEPIGKNTATSIGWATAEIIKKDPEAIIVILPSDHWVDKTICFQECIQKAAALAEKEEKIVTLGIRPTHPHTGYGYIKTSLTESDIYNVESFREKPDKETAKQYILNGNYYWNAGIFAFKASTLMQLLKKHLPKHARLLSKANIKDHFEEFEAISFDYGIMEKAHADTLLIPAYFNWNDIGSWSSLEQFLKKDSHNNAVKGNLISIDSKNNIVYSDKTTIALADVSNMIIIDTPNTLLILNKENDQKIKDIYDQLDDSLK